MSNFSLQGKTIIVTGGAGGLGRAMVAKYAQAGANVVIASRTEQKSKLKRLTRGTRDTVPLQ